MPKQKKQSQNHNHRPRGLSLRQSKRVCMGKWTCIRHTRESFGCRVRFLIPGKLLYQNRTEHKAQPCQWDELERFELSAEWRIVNVLLHVCLGRAICVYNLLRNTLCMELQSWVFWCRTVFRWWLNASFFFRWYDVFVCPVHSFIGFFSFCVFQLIAAQ